MIQERTKRPSHELLLGGVLFALLSFLVLIMVPDSSFAAPMPKVIDGHVFEGDHSHPVANAHVHVYFKDSSGNDVVSYQEDNTDSAGFYTVSTWYEYSVVVKIVAVASYDSNQKSVEVVDNDGPAQHVDVPFPYAIPQLAGIGGTIAGVSILGVVAVVSLRKKPLQN